MEFESSSEVILIPVRRAKHKALLRVMPCVVTWGKPKKHKFPYMNSYKNLSQLSYIKIFTKDFIMEKNFKWDYCVILIMLILFLKLSPFPI